MNKQQIKQMMEKNEYVEITEDEYDNLQNVGEVRYSIEGNTLYFKPKEEPKSELVFIPELNIEIEKNLHIEMDKINKIVIPQGYRLLELSELLFIYNNYQDKFNWGKDKHFDEITSQPIKDNKKYPYWNAWLHWLVDDYRSELVGYCRSLNCNYEVRGCRFCKESLK